MSLIGTLVVSIVGDNKAFKSSLADSKKQLSGFGAAVQKHSAAFMKTGAVMMGFAGAICIAAIKVGKEFDKAYNKIRTGTGKTGKVLEGLKKDFRKVAKDVPNSLDEVSIAIADLNTRLGLTGKPLQAMAKQMLNLARITETDVNAVIRTSTRLFGDWDVAVEDQAETLDYLYKVSQSTGVGIDKLSDMVTTYGVQLRTVGFTMEESLALMGKWEKEGVSAEKMLGGLSMALGKFAKAQKEPEEAFRQLVQQIEEATTVGKAMELGVEALGTRAGPDFALAVREGRFAVEDFVAELAGSSETINQAAEDTMTLTEKFDLLKNRAKLAIEPLAKKLMDELSPALEKITDKLGDLDEEQLDNIASSVLFATKVLAVGGAILFVLPKIYQLRTAMIALRGTMLGAASVYTAVAAAMLGIGQAGDWASRKIDNYYLASLARAVLQHSEVLHTGKNLIEVIRGLQDNTLTWSEFIRMNGREIDEWAQKHREGIEDIEGFNEALESAEKFVKNYGDELPLASAAMVDLIQNYQDGTLSAEGFIIGVEELRKATQNGKVDIEDATKSVDDFNEKQEIARRKVDAHTKAQKEAKQPIDDTTKSIEDQRKEVDDLISSFGNLIDDIFGGITTYNDFQEANWAVEEAEKAVAEAIKEHGADSVEAMKAQNNLDDAMIANIKTAFELSTSIDATTEAQEEGRKKAIELGLQYVATGEISVQEFIDMAAQFGMSTADILEYAEKNNIDINAVYKNVADTGIENFIAMATGFGLSGQQIMDKADELGITVDTATRLRVLDIDADTIGVDKAIKDVTEKADKLDGKVVTITFKGRQIGAMPAYAKGGIASYLKGGIAGSDGFSLPLLTAAQGLITLPRADEGMLAVLHPPELVLNPDQALRVLWKIANEPAGAKSSSIQNTFYISELIVREEADVHKIAEDLYDLQQTKQRGAGYK